MKRWQWEAAALLLVCLAAGAGTVRADANPANDTDALTLTITPNVDFGVDRHQPGAPRLGRGGPGQLHVHGPAGDVHHPGQLQQPGAVLDALVTASGGTPWRRFLNNHGG